MNLPRNLPGRDGAIVPNSDEVALIHELSSLKAVLPSDIKTSPIDPINRHCTSSACSPSLRFFHRTFSPIGEHRGLVSTTTLSPIFLRVAAYVQVRPQLAHPLNSRLHPSHYLVHRTATTPSSPASYFSLFMSTATGNQPDASFSNRPASASLSKCSSTCSRGSKSSLPLPPSVSCANSTPPPFPTSAASPSP
jgi:hypothetical protein